MVCPPGRGRASIAAWGPDRGPTAAKQHLKQNRLCAMIGGLDWWFAPRAAVGLRLQRGAPIGPDGCKAASKAKPAVRYVWWLGLVVCPPGRSRASIAVWGPDRGPTAAKQHLKQNRLCARLVAWIGGLPPRPRSGFGCRVGPRSGPDGCKAASKAKPAVRYGWWLGLVVCPPGRGRASIAAWGPDRGPTAAKQHLKQNRLCAMIGGLDWWFAGPRPGFDCSAGPRSGPDACKAASKAKPAVCYGWWLGLVVGPRSGPDGCKAASKAKPAVCYDWWLGLVVCPPGRGRASIAAWGPDRGPTAAKQHLKQNRLCAMIGGLDWWFAPRAAVGLRLQRRAPMAPSGPDRGRSGPDGCMCLNSDILSKTGCDWWLGLVVSSRAPARRL